MKPVEVGNVCFPMGVAARLVLLCTYRVGVCSAAPQSVVRVGVLGWLNPIVLQSQPAKSTSSTSDRFINVWFCNTGDKIEEKNDG